jgi:hypothetical protein
MCGYVRVFWFPSHPLFISCQYLPLYFIAPSVCCAHTLARYSFLGIVDLIGTTYVEDFLATGFGSHLAIPLIRDRWHTDMSEEEARTLLEDCMRVLYYRDCRATNKVCLLLLLLPLPPSLPTSCIGCCSFSFPLPSSRRV